MGLVMVAKPRAIRRCLLSGLLALAVTALVPIRAASQLFSSPRTTLSTTVTGSVVDAVTGQGVGHALVRLGQRATLTDSEGHFTFQRVDQTQLSVSAMKPGYSFTRNAGEASEVMLQAADLNDALVLRLYPEALLLGTVQDEEGRPVRNLAVTALRRSNDDDGRHWTTAAVAHTNARGQFRLGVPAGDYRLESEYLKIAPQQALLPAVAPDFGGRLLLHVRSGEQVNADLHPVAAPLVDVMAHVDGEPLRELTQLNVLSENGRRFPVTFTATGAADMQMTLPLGSYVLEARHWGFGGGGSDVAAIDVTQPQTQPLAVALHFAPVAPIQVEIRADDASFASIGTGRGQNVPTVGSLGFTLEPTNGTASSESEPLRPVQRFNESLFNAPAGTYRLRVRSGGSWYVVSATAGGVDLLNHDLLIAAGSAPLPIEIVVSNQTASVKGTVTIGGHPLRGWVYLLAAYPSASPLYPVHCADDGTYTLSALPPGSYSAIAFSQRYSFDPYDADALANYSSHLASLTVQPGDQAILDLEAVSDAEMKP